MTAGTMRHAVIMAAGRGIRMMPLTDAMPKAMAPYNGTTLIAHGIDQIRPYVGNVHVTVGYRGAMLAQHVIQHGAASVFNTEGHGNCWWIYNTFLSLLDEPVLVLTCDNVVELDFALLTSEYFAYDEPACMLVPVTPVPGLEGDYISHDDHVVTCVDRHAQTEIYCSGIQVLNPSKVRHLVPEVDDFDLLWEQLIPLRQLRASRVYPERWFTVDTLDHLKLLSDAALASGSGKASD